ncbi:efflux RND transporter periplasmic adaptor subunit [Pendulispora brunnea]|uniref:Efflux RND transporter periplasmic adaptor subunit n=1 Tax=Pendulispora brunnea TaxID=2905690 RepID=A0ABZ2KKK1_9BACT
MSAESAAQANQPNKPKRNTAFHIGGIVLVALAVLGVITFAVRKRSAEANERNARQAEAAEGVLVQAAPVAKTQAGRSITLTGEVYPMRRATLYAKVSGYVREVRTDKGQKVHAGEVLGVLQSPETQQDLLRAQADLNNRQLVEKRYQSMVKQGLVTQQALEQATADRGIAQAEQQRIEVLQGYQVIRAPFDGVVTARYADPGSLLQAATASQAALPLVEIADMAKVRVRVFLAQNEALFVHENDPVTLWTDQFPDKKISATVTRFARDLDPKTRTMLTEIEVDNTKQADGGLYPGVFVRVKLDLKTPPAVTMPADSLVIRGGKSFAFVVRDSKAVLVPVSAGDTDGINVYLREGLNPGDQVILHPGDEVIEGAKVRVAQKEKMTALNKP